MARSQEEPDKFPESPTATYITFIDGFGNIIPPPPNVKCKYTAFNIFSGLARVHGPIHTV